MKSQHIFFVVVAVAFIVDFFLPKYDAVGQDVAICLESEAQFGQQYGCWGPQKVSHAAASILPILNRIVESPYFRYVRVNTEKECPYWAVSVLCTHEDAPCSVWSCDPADVPEIFHCVEDMCNVELDQVCFTQPPPKWKSNFPPRERPQCRVCQLA